MQDTWSANDYVYSILHLLLAPIANWRAVYCQNVWTVHNNGHPLWGTEMGNLSPNTSVIVYVSFQTLKMIHCFNHCKSLLWKSYSECLYMYHWIFICCLHFIVCPYSFWNNWGRQQDPTKFRWRCGRVWEKRGYLCCGSWCGRFTNKKKCQVKRQCDCPKRRETSTVEITGT